jgi:hypothetical protein
VIESGAPARRRRPPGARNASQERADFFPSRVFYPPHLRPNGARQSRLSRGARSHRRAGSRSPRASAAAPPRAGQRVDLNSGRSYRGPVFGFRGHHPRAARAMGRHNLRIAELPPDRLQRSQPAFLVGPHKPRVARDIGREDGRQPTGAVTPVFLDPSCRLSMRTRARAAGFRARAENPAAAGGTSGLTDPLLKSKNY